MSQVLGNVPAIVTESAVESALLWVLVLAYIRCFNVKYPAIRAAAFLLPLIIPVALTTTFHVLLPQRPSEVNYFKFLETPIDGYTAGPFSIWLLFLVAEAVGVAASVVLLCRQWRTWTQARSMWQQQQQQETPLHRRCNAVLKHLVARFDCPAPRLVLTDSGNPGSLALGRCGYIFVPVTIAVQLDNEELEALFAHEIGHIAKRDGLVGLVAKICRNLMLFNPLAYIVLSKLENEQEKAADELALKLGCTRLGLASCLLKSYRLGDQRIGLPVTALLNREIEIERRIRRLLDGGKEQTPARFSWPALGILAGVATSGLALLV